MLLHTTTLIKEHLLLNDFPSMNAEVDADRQRINVEIQHQNARLDELRKQLEESLQPVNTLSQ